MRKIAATYILPVSSPPLPNGIVVTDDDGSVREVIDTRGKIRESSRLEFYNGVITPGFVIPCHRAADRADDLSEREFRDFDRSLLQQGIKGIGLIEKRAGHFAQKKESRVTYHTILEVCPATGKEEFEVYRQGIDLISWAWNEFNQTCSVGCCTKSLMETHIAAYILQYAATHRGVIPLEDSVKWPIGKQLKRLRQQMERLSEQSPGGLSLNAHLVCMHDPADLAAGAGPLTDEALAVYHSPALPRDLNVLKAMLAWQEGSPHRSLLDILPAFTLTAAGALFEDHALGSIEAGKSPGLNLLSHAGPGTFCLSAKSTLRVLVH